MKLATRITLPLAALAAGLMLTTGARADDANWISDLTCDSLPTDAPTGWQVRAYLAETSLQSGKVEIYQRTSGTVDPSDPNSGLTLVHTFPATKDINTGNASELVDIWTAESFHLEYRLKLDLDDPNNPNPETAFVKYQGEGDGLDLQLTCW